MFNSKTCLFSSKAHPFRKENNMKRLIVIISDDCPYCHRLTEELNRRNVEYELINISSEPEKVQALGVGIYGLPASIVKDENNTIWA